jgi:HEPN domain-containing protein
MSQTKNRRHAERWLRTAEEDLRAAEALLEAGLYAQACFYAQQSGEKAVNKFYIPTRYPNGLPDLTPGQVYRRGDAERGLKAARELVEACNDWLEQHSGQPA